MFSLKAAGLFPVLTASPHEVAAEMYHRLPDATPAEVATAASAIYGEGFAASVLRAWTVAEYERRTGHAF